MKKPFDTDKFRLVTEQTFTSTKGRVHTCKIGVFRDGYKGYFSIDGEDSGGLWFNTLPLPATADGTYRLTLSDYDGVYELPRVVVRMLKEADIVVTENFE